MERMHMKINPIRAEGTVRTDKKTEDWTEEIKLLEERLSAIKRASLKTALTGAIGLPGRALPGESQQSGWALRGGPLEQLAYVQLLNEQGQRKKEERKRNRPSIRYDNSLGTNLFPETGWEHEENHRQKKRNRDLASDRSG